MYDMFVSANYWMWEGGGGVHFLIVLCTHWYLYLCKKVCGPKLSPCLKLPMYAVLKEGLKRRSPAVEYISERPYTAVFDDELSFAKDAVLHIVEKSLNGWWLARFACVSLVCWSGYSG